MARPPRKEFEGALYHVTSRGNGRGRIFFDDADTARFRSQLEDCLENYGVVLYAYALMPNHYHLLVRTPRGNLGRFMQRLNTSYALYSRYKHHKSGHRLEGRYKAKLVQGDEYILTLTRYIHLNPAKVKAAQGEGKAARRRRVERCGWSSYAGYVEERRVEPFVSYDILRALDADLRKARRKYRAYALSCLDKDDEELRTVLGRSGYGIGDEQYVEALEWELRNRRSGTVKDRDVAYPAGRIAAERIDEVVARTYGTTIEALREHGRRTGAGAAKLAALELACRLSGMTQREIGLRYGGISSQAVSLARQRAKVAVGQEELLRLSEVVRTQTSQNENL